MALQNADKKKDEDKKDVPPATADLDPEHSKEGTAAERLLDRIIARHGTSPQGVAKGLFPLSYSEREGVLRVCQTRFGNLFVTMVERELGLMNQPGAAGASIVEAAEPEAKAEEKK